MSDPHAVADDEQRHIVQVIFRNARQLHTAIERLLTLQAFTMMGGQIKRTPVSPHTLIMQELPAWQREAQPHGISIEYLSYAPTTWILGEPTFLVELFRLLIENAIKFSKPLSLREEKERTVKKVHIALWSVPCYLHIAVCDEGIGLSNDVLERIFDPFFQVDAGPSRPYEGLGIGLSLARAIVEIHQGRIWAESEGAGKGSTIHIELPRGRIIPDNARMAALLPVDNAVSYP